MMKLKKLKHWKFKIQTEEQLLSMLKEYGGNRAVCDWGHIAGRLKQFNDQAFNDFLINRILEFGIWCEKNKLVEHSDKPFKLEKKEKIKLPSMCG